MNEQHRTTIQRNYSVLVQRANIDDLLPLLVTKKVFSPEMVTKYSNGPNDLERKRSLFLDIQMRGPQAFVNLVGALCESGQARLASLLDPSVNTNRIVAQQLQKRHAVPFMLPANEDVPINNLRSIRNVNEASYINLRNEPLNIEVKGATRLYDQDLSRTYSTHSKNRGVALIINNIEYINNIQQRRKGAEVDGENLKTLFTQMGLQVVYYTNLTKKDMENVILDFKASQTLSHVDMVFVIIMSHGIDSVGTAIVGTDNESLETSWIEQKFNNVHCKPLQHKPKIIIYQTCRGHQPDFGVAQRIEVDSAVNNSAVRSVSDMLVAHSTAPGFSSHRDIYLGAWYINLFCQVVMEEAHRLDLEAMLRMVDHKLNYLRTSKQTMQTAVYTNIGFRTCYIHPKVYAENGTLRNIFDDTTIE